MTRNRLIAASLVLAGGLVWFLAWEPTGRAPVAGGQDGGVVRHQPLKPLDLAAVPRGGDFSLDSAKGPVDLASLRGQVVLIYFGYTWCPDICPTNLAFIASALRELTPEELRRVRVLFVSVDPERDDPRRLADYSAYFHPNILGLTGTPERVARAASLYGAAYRRSEQSDSAMGYLVDHSAQTYVVDPAGHLARTLDHATPPNETLAVIRGLLATPPSGEGFAKR